MINLDSLDITRNAFEGKVAVVTGAGRDRITGFRTHGGLSCQEGVVN